MGEKVPQTFANHTRFDPIFHFFSVPLAFAFLIWAIVHLIRYPRFGSLPWLVCALLIFLTLFIARTYALKVQDRVIRLEENIRLAKLSASVPSLTEKQLVALRFASDAELPALAEKAAAGNLTGKQIKQAIQTWRPDYFRV